MALVQYDVVLTQNVAAAGTEFSEKIIHLNKGSLLSADTNHVPTVLAVGTDTYILVADSNEATGLKWVAVSGGHTQNTDTGTTSNTFTIDSDSSTGKIVLDVALNAGEDHTMTITNAVMTADVTLTLPAVTGTLATQAYADGLFASNDAMIFKGTVGTGGTHTIVAFNALATYDTGWTYRVIEAGTIKGKVCEIGDLVMAIVDRAGSSNVDADWTVAQTNLDGAVIGAASVTDNNICQFNGTTGKLIEDSGLSNTDVASAISLKHAAVTVSAGGGLVLSTQVLSMWSAAPAAYNSDCSAVGIMAYDGNYWYIGVTAGSGGSGRWSRSVTAKNW
jgi:hypothetical protein